MRLRHTAAALSAALLITLAAAPTTAAEHGAPDEAFRDPASYTFSIAHITDTQYLSSCAANWFNAQRDRCDQIYKGMNQWIVDNAANRKIAYTSHTGDIIDAYWGWFPLIAKKQFEKASQAQKILDDAGLPNGVLPGNHDNRTGASPTLYNSYFGPQRYAPQPTYAGPWKDGDNSNHIDDFSAGGYDFSVVHLGYEVRADAVAWANEQIKARPHRNVIVATHAYLKPGPAPDGVGAALSHDGSTVREQVVKDNPNVFMVLSGHEHGVARNVLTDFGSPGHQVIELMANYQDYSAGSDGKGHAGFVRLLQFDTRRGEVTVDTYSPSLNSFRSRDYDTQAGRHYDGSEDEFTVPVRLIASN